MSAAQECIASTTYALFALEQPISLYELEVAARDSRFPMAATLTPGWFAAAARDDSSLLETAPELLVLPADLEAAAHVDVTGIDLIHVYAPELMPEAVVQQVAEPIEEPEPEPDAEMPRTSTQLGLLKELSGLDG